MLSLKYMMRLEELFYFGYNKAKSVNGGGTMKFRPCIDIHNGMVKQIVGGSLKDEMNQAIDNFVSEQDAAWYARLYREKGLIGGHIILLNPEGSEYYDADLAQAMGALEAFPGGLMIGGGIHSDNAMKFIRAGASHVIVTSYVFKEGKIDFEHLKAIHESVGREHLVLDLSCRKRDGGYYIVTDRWQNYTDVMLNEQTIAELSSHCDEFLVHAVDVEGKANGIEEEVALMLGKYCDIPATYAGGVHSYEDLALLKKLGMGKVDVTIGSALDLFGGTMSFEKVIKICE